MNKQGIRNQVLALLNRNDCSDELADTFIEQAVARIQRTLRVPAMEKAESYTINAVASDSLILPNDFMSMKLLYCGDTLLEYVDLQRFLQYPVGGRATPRIYTRIQGELKIKPIPQEGTEILMVYYGEIPDLITDTDTNFVTEIAPDLLTYAALTYAADYFVDERKPYFEETYGRVYSELMEQANLTEMEQSGMRLGVPYAGEY
jgi:hypothetical protein